MSESTRLKFLAYYYNKEADWGKEVVASYNDGFNTNTAVKQYERGGPADLTTPFWLSEDAISSSTWSYIEGIKYYTSTVLLHRLLDIVSKNGNLILNISPKADGTIPTEQRTILLAMGDWLRNLVALSMGREHGPYMGKVQQKWWRFFFCPRCRNREVFGIHGQKTLVPFMQFF
jgi:alpha-L-fucosidase